MKVEQNVFQTALLTLVFLFFVKQVNNLIKQLLIPERNRLQHTARLPPVPPPQLACSHCFIRALTAGPPCEAAQRETGQREAPARALKSASGPLKSNQPAARCCCCCWCCTASAQASQVKCLLQKKCRAVILGCSFTETSIAGTETPPETVEIT